MEQRLLQNNSPKNIKLNLCVRTGILLIFTMLMFLNNISKNLLQIRYQLSDLDLYYKLHIVYYLSLPIGATVFQMFYKINEKNLLLSSFLLLIGSMIPLLLDIQNRYCVLTTFIIKGISKGIYFTFSIIWIEKFSRRDLKYFSVCFFFFGRNLGHLVSEILYDKISKIELNKYYFASEITLYIIIFLFILQIDPIYFSDKLDCINYKNCLFVRLSLDKTEEKNSDYAVSINSQFKLRQSRDSTSELRFFQKQKLVLLNPLNSSLIGYMFLSHLNLKLFNEWLLFSFNISQKLKNPFNYLHLSESLGICISLIFFLLVFKIHSKVFTLKTFLLCTIINFINFILCLIFNNNSYIISFLSIMYYCCIHITIPISQILSISMVSRSLRSYAVGLSHTFAFLSLAGVFIFNYIFNEKRFLEFSLYVCIVCGGLSFLCCMLTYFNMMPKKKQRQENSLEMKSEISPRMRYKRSMDETEEHEFELRQDSKENI